MKNSLNRISALLLRYLYLIRSSWPRLVELAFWPTLEMIIWGFTSTYFVTRTGSSMTYGVSVLIGGALLWDFLIRTQMGVSVNFLEELWSRNLGHLFISPIRPWEWIVALIISSTIRALLSVLPAVALAICFFHYNLFSMGLPLVGFLICLFMMGWWFGFLVIAIIMRFGQGAEILAWMLVYAISPISAVFYPVSILPGWLQAVAFAFPSSHIFEGMRAVIMHQTFNVSEIWWAFGLNVIYTILSLIILRISFRNARSRGALLNVGE